MTEDHTAEEKVYKLSDISKTKWVGITIVILFIGFFLNFPVTNVIKGQVRKSLASMRNCPITYDSIEVEYFFFPKIILRGPTIHGICFNNPSESLKLDELMVRLYFPGFLPPGIRFHIPLRYENTRIDIYPTLTFGKIHINIKDSLVEAKFLEKVTGKLKNLKGQLEINAITNMGSKGIIDGVFLIKSKDLTIGPQNLAGLTLPNLPIKNILIKAELDHPKLSLLDVIIGDQDSPLRANLKGDINLNRQHFQSSTLDLDGNVFFQPGFSSIVLDTQSLSGRKKNG